MKTKRPRKSRSTPKQSTERTEPDAVVYPNVDQVPDWSPATLAAMEQLTELEAAFVAWMATGLSAAESYKRAAGLKSSQAAHAKQYGYAIKHRPRVQEALSLALKDRNFTARFDLEWLMQNLHTITSRGLEIGTPAGLQVSLASLRTIAQLQEFLQPKDTSSPKVNPQPTIDIRERVQAIIDEARAPRLAASLPATPETNHNASLFENDAQHHATEIPVPPVTLPTAGNNVNQPSERTLRPSGQLPQDGGWCWQSSSENEGSVNGTGPLFRVS
jgi:hypothetical protein